MIRLVNVHDAKTNLSKLLLAVEDGEEILIGRAGEPIAKLTAVQRSKRELGFAAGQLWLSDDFDKETQE